MSIEAEEKAKYDRLYSGSYPATGYCIETAKFIANTAHRGDSILDLGCGHGRAVIWLRDHDYNCKGVDITLKGLPSSGTPGFIEAPLWDLPFEKYQFDYTFSTDVMEHIPTSMVDKVLREIYRVTRVETFHCISIDEDPNFPEAHMTVRPIDWWVKRFEKLNHKQVDTRIVDPDMYKILRHYVTDRRIGYDRHCDSDT